MKNNMDHLQDPKKLYFDVRDAMLLLGGFVAIVAAVSVMHFTTGYSPRKWTIKAGAAAMLGLPIARRAIFGQPAVRTVRTGPVWSLVSIVSLFLMLGAFLAVVVAGISVLGLAESVDPELGAEYVAEQRQMLLQRIGWSVLTTAILGGLASVGLESRFVRNVSVSTNNGGTSSNA